MFKMMTHILIMAISLTAHQLRAETIDDCDLEDSNVSDSTFSKEGIVEWLKYQRDIDNSADPRERPCEFNFNTSTQVNDPKPFAYFAGQHNNISDDFNYHFSLKKLSETLSHLKYSQYVTFFSIGREAIGIRTGINLMSLQIREKIDNSDFWEIEIFWNGQNHPIQRHTFLLSKNSDDARLIFNWHKDMGSNVSKISLSLNGTIIFEKDVFVRHAPNSSKLGLINSNGRMDLDNTMHFGEVY